MTSDEIASWALRHGFTDVGGGRYETLWKGATIALMAGPVWVTTRIEKDGQSQRLAQSARKRLHIEDDMLMGVGLGYTFFMGFMQTVEDRPPWIDADKAAKILGVPADEAITKPGPQP